MAEHTATEDEEAKPRVHVVATYQPWLRPVSYSRAPSIGAFSRNSRLGHVRLSQEIRRPVIGHRSIITENIEGEKPGKNSRGETAELEVFTAAHARREQASIFPSPSCPPKRGATLAVCLHRVPQLRYV